MPDQPVTHPTPDHLRAFGLGQMTVADAETVQSHLAACPECQKAVAELTADTFLGRLRDQAKDATPGPDGSLGSLARNLTTAANPSPPSLTPIDDIPPELANNPEYEVVRELGRGGMGVVYLAKNRLMGRDEVLKVMGPAVMARPGATARFLREIQSAARLGHPNIVRAYAARQLGDQLMLAMEYVPGDELGKLVKARGRLPVLNACVYAQQVASGLQHAHEHGMVHRDIKPANLILARNGRRHSVKILDFGLAKLTSEDGPEEELTGTGQMMGTPHYMAPEQALDAARADIRADIYSLGCTLYYLLAGETPFSGGGLAVVVKHKTESARPLTDLRPDVPAELAAVVAKMMAKSPADRYQTPAEVIRALAPFIRKDEEPAPKPGPPPKENPPPKESPAPKENAFQEWVQAAASQVPPAAPVPRPVPPQPLIPLRDDEWESISAPTMQALDLPPPPPARISFPLPPAPSPRRTPVWVWPASAVGLALLLLGGLWAAGVIRVRTREGVIVLNNLPPDADVEVDGEAVTVSRKGQEFTVTVTRDGTHRVRVLLGGQELLAKDVDVTLGGTPVTVRVEKPADDEFVPLFNGKDLTGWKTHPSQPGNWKVEGGVLVGRGPDTSHLYTERDDYEDVQLRAEVKIDSSGNSGIIARCGFGPTRPPGKPTWVEGYEAQINAAAADPNRTGSLYTGQGVAVIVREAPVPAGRWFTLDVELLGETITVRVNGTETARYTDTQRLYKKGHLALQVHDAVTEVQFKSVRVRRLRRGVAAAPPQTLDVDLGGGEKLSLVRIDPPARPDRGVFQMGSSPAALAVVKLNWNETPGDEPAHECRLTRPYYLGRYEVTRGQFRAFVDATGYKTEAEVKRAGGFGWNLAKSSWQWGGEFSWREPGFPQTDLHPVVLVSWNDARRFCEWAQGLAWKTPGADVQIRLPTEAEWEYGCRAGSADLFFFGDDIKLLRVFANAAGTEDGVAQTATVGAFRPNPFGLYDTCGNVWEWCADWYGDRTYTAASRTDPTGPGFGERRITRGSSWYWYPHACRSAGRSSRGQGERLCDLGFRVAGSVGK